MDVLAKALYSLFTIYHSLLCCLLHNLNYPPALLCRERARLNNAHAIADGRPQIVMRHKLRRATHVTAILWMQHLAIDSHDDGLLHLVGRNGADFLNAIAAPTLLCRAITLSAWAARFSRFSCRTRGGFRRRSGLSFSGCGS